MTKNNIPMTALFIKTALAVSIAQGISQPTKVTAACYRPLYANCKTTHNGVEVSVPTCLCIPPTWPYSGYTRCDISGNGCEYPGSSCDMGGDYCIS